MLIGSHVIKTWSSTQAIVALPSSEAAYYGITKSGCTATGLKSFSQDSLVNITMTIYIDFAAARSVASRRGLGKLRHMDVQYLWIQEKLPNKTFKLLKVLGADNPADALTKFLDEPSMMRHLRRLHVEHHDGRSAAAPQLHTHYAAQVVLFCGIQMEVFVW